MRAGRLRHSIEIQVPLDATDSVGGIATTWQTFTQTRASYEPRSGKEAYISQQEHATATCLFRLRFKAGVTTKMRVVFDGRFFDIESVIDLYGRGRELNLMCTENV